MAKRGAREIVGLICSECKSQNYATMRNKVNMETKSASKSAKLEVKKYCKNCHKHTPHKETTKLK